MKIYTSYFAKKLPNDVLRVSIALWPPKGFKGLRLQNLAPTSSILLAYKKDNDWEKYTEQYFNQVLSRINANDLVNRLEAMAKGYNANDVALICYEKSGDNCHRNLVAGWLTGWGYKVEEYGQ